MVDDLQNIYIYIKAGVRKKTKTLLKKNGILAQMMGYIGETRSYRHADDFWQLRKAIKMKGEHTYSFVTFKQFLVRLFRYLMKICAEEGWRAGRLTPS